MNKKLCKTEFLDKENLHNIDTTKLNGKLLIYKDISQDSQKSGYNYFYYNEEEKNDISDSIKQIKSRNKNNLLNLKTNKTKENNNKNKNKNMSKKTKSLFNFVFKDDKNKNLIINYYDDDKKYNNYNSDFYINLKTLDVNRNNKTFNKNNKNKSNIIEYNTNNANNVISNIHPYKEIVKKKEINTKSIIKNRNFSAKFCYKFNTDDLAKIKIEPLKIISQKVVELPKVQICYITKYFKYLKPLKIPKNDICFYKSSYIYKDYKITLPKNEICYFNKNFIFFKIKLKNINNRKKDSLSEKKETKKSKDIFEKKDTKKTKDISEKKDTKKNKEKKSQEKQHKNLVNNNNINEVINNNVKMRKSNIVHRNENPDLNKEAKLIKHKSYFIQSNFNNYKPLNKENKIKKLENKKNIFSKIINFNKNKEIEKIKTKNKKDNKINKLTFLPNLIENKKEDSNSSSSFDKSSKKSNLFNHLLKKKEDNSKIYGLKQSLNKVILHKNISNDNLSKINNNDLIIPKIKNDRNNFNYEIPKTQISPNIISSKIVKKINFSKNICRNNNNHLTNVKNQASEEIQSYTLLDSSRQNIQKNKSMNDISKPNLPFIKQEINKLRNNFIFPYQLKNESTKNDEENIFSGLSRNKIITLKKINYSNNNYNENTLLEIKQYFNNKKLL